MSSYKGKGLSMVWHLWPTSSKENIKFETNRHVHLVYWPFWAYHKTCWIILMEFTAYCNIYIYQNKRGKTVIKLHSTCDRPSIGAVSHNCVWYCEDLISGTICEQHSCAKRIFILIAPETIIMYSLYLISRNLGWMKNWTCKGWVSNLKLTHENIRVLTEPCKGGVSHPNLTHDSILYSIVYWLY